MEISVVGRGEFITIDVGSIVPVEFEPGNGVFVGGRSMMVLEGTLLGKVSVGGSSVELGSITVS